MKTGLRAAIAMIVASYAPAAICAEKSWNFELTPYLWAAGINGDAIVAGQPAEVDVGFSDLIEAAELGGALLMRAERAHWVFWAQADYTALSTDQLDNPPERGRLDFDTTMFTGGLGRNFESANGRRSLDVLLGVRYLELESTLRFQTLGTFDGKATFTDPVIILRPSFQLSERWRLNPTFSYGTGGDSESTYELQPQVQFKISDSKALRFGYRRLHYDIENTSTGNSFDGQFEGLFFGYSMLFGGEPEPSPAPPPPPPPVANPTPPPPPPPPPGDGDKDGVTDDKDRCPSTAAGIQVDAIGCFREVTLRGVLFETNSTELNAEARALLDQTASAFKTLPADVAAGVSVVVEGHTDSTGADAYNQDLSQRRAEAAREHLIGAGIPGSLIKATGMGEASPTDTNDTAAGRANNRRVVIRATR